MSTPGRGRARESVEEEVFRRLPYGVAVVDASGVITRANEAAVALLPALDGDAPRCGEVLDCAGPDGPCAHGCLAARAATAEAPLPEIRIDTAPGATCTAVWVTAAPLPEGRALLHLRPGDARDRRRRSDPHWLNGPELRIRALGRLRLESAEGQLGGDWLGRRAGQVLKYLVCERDRVVHAEEIADALWPGSGRQGLNNVRHFIHQLRDRLEPGRERRAPSAFVVAVGGGYAINRRNVQIDADEFERAAGDGFAALDRDDPVAGRAALERAAALYGGDFLADEPYAEWAYEERNRLRALAARVLRALARILVIEDDLQAAAVQLGRLSELEPFDSDIHRDLFAVLLAQGRRTEATRGYAAFRMRVLREFGEEPDFTLAELTPLLRRRTA